MSSDDTDDSAGDEPKTARTMGHLVKDSREVNKSQTVHEVGSNALEATFHVMDSHPSPTVSELRDGDLADHVATAVANVRRFINVLSNAAVHNDDPVTVRVDTEEPSPDRLVVGFADDGKGVPADLREELFQMRKKGPESQGTGFGLGFARALTRSDGGVEVRESERAGVDFRVTLEWE